MVDIVFRLAVAVAVVGCCGTAYALGISPVIVELTPSKPVASITISNTAAAAPIVFQAHTLGWRQEDGRDRYEETEDLVVVPAIAEVATDGSQIFRIALRSPSVVPAERAYRFILEDITEIKPPTGSKENTLVFRVSHNLPVYITPVGVSPQAQPHMTSCPSPQGKACVRLDNDGNSRLKITGFALEGAGGVRNDVKMADTVLGGAWKQWTFDMPAKYTGPLTVRAETSAGPLEVELSSAPL